MKKYLLYFILSIVPFLFIFSGSGMDSAGFVNIVIIFAQHISIYIIALIIVLPFKPNTPFLVAIALDFPLFYLLHILQIKFNNLHDNGLGILVYIFSLFGLGLGLLIAGIIYKKMQLQSNMLKSFLTATVIPLVGFIINYIVMCNTLAYCGCLSFLK